MSEDIRQRVLSPPKVMDALGQDQPSAEDSVTSALRDAKVIRKLLNAALAALRNRHLGMLHAQREAEAEDIVQEVARRALTRKADYDSGRCVVRWLVGFVMLVCMERAKNHPVPQCPNDRADPMPLEEIVVDLCRPAEEEVADRIDVRQMLDRLPAADRELVWRRFYDHATPLEIAQELKVTEGAVRVRLHRVLARLRNQVAAKGEVQP
jgi:RNA polymerase sigma-70 factor (ECF subfamily)